MGRDDICGERHKHFIQIVIFGHNISLKIPGELFRN